MATEILMPALSPTMEEGTLAKWLVKEGDTVSSGDIMAEIETDKATMEFEAVDEGVIGKILVPEGTEGVAVNTAIAILVEDGEDVSDVAVSAPAAAPAAEAPAPAPVAAAPAAPQVDNTPDWPEGTPMKQQTVREALRDGMSEEMRRDELVYLMGEEVAEYQGAYKVSQGMLDEFGAKRVIDTPITEHGFAGIATGSAMAGLRPVVEFMTFNFAMQAIDHIINSAAKTLYMSGGKGLMKTAIRDDNPVIFLENEILYGRSFDVPDIDDYTVPFGKARIWREGTDVTIVSFGIGMQYALEAADKLAEDGISAEVLDLRTLRPMDTDSIIKSVMKTNRCVTVEEGWPQGSVGSYISSVLMQQAFDYLDAPVINCTGKDVPMPYAANLEKHALITTAEVIEAVKTVTYR